MKPNYSKHRGARFAMSYRQNITPTLLLEYYKELSKIEQLLNRFIKIQRSVL
jgi:hypothetical protein